MCTFFALAKTMDDALTIVAAYCDIDTRRALKCGPNRLVRDAAFDERLQMIHRSGTVRSSQTQWANRWTVRLNARHDIVIDQNGCVHCMQHSFGTSGNSLAYPQSSVCEFNTCYSTGEQRMTCMIRHDPPLKAQGFVHSVFENGRWVCWRPKTFADGQLEALKKLGYVFANHV
jgi:hypothetical protein